MVHASAIDRECYRRHRDMTSLNAHGRSRMVIGWPLFFLVFSWEALSFGAELFPFTPPSSGPQRPFEQGSQGKSQLSKEDFDRISKTANLAKQLPTDEKKKLKIGIQRDLREAAAQGNLNQVTYFTELLVQIGQENSRP